MRCAPEQDGSAVVRMEGGEGGVPSGGLGRRGTKNKGGRESPAVSHFSLLWGSHSCALVLTLYWNGLLIASFTNLGAL